MNRVKVAMYKCELCDAELKLFVGKNFTPPKRCEECKKFALKQVEDESTYTTSREPKCRSFSRREGRGSGCAIDSFLKAIP